MSPLNGSAATYIPVVRTACNQIAAKHPGLSEFITATELELEHDRRNGGYTLEWADPKAELPGRFRIYSDGAWVWDKGENGAGRVEGKIKPLHYQHWNAPMLRAGLDGRVAHFAIRYFKDLTRKSR